MKDLYDTLDEVINLIRQSGHAFNAHKDKPKEKKLHDDLATAVDNLEKCVTGLNNAATFLELKDTVKFKAPAQRSERAVLRCRNFVLYLEQLIQSFRSHKKSKIDRKAVEISAEQIVYNFCHDHIDKMQEIKNDIFGVSIRKCDDHETPDLPESKESITNPTALIELLDKTIKIIGHSLTAEYFHTSICHLEISNETLVMAYLSMFTEYKAVDTENGKIDFEDKTMKEDVRSALQSALRNSKDAKNYMEEKVMLAPDKHKLTQKDDTVKDWLNTAIEDIKTIETLLQKELEATTSEAAETPARKIEFVSPGTGSIPHDTLSPEDPRSPAQSTQSIFRRIIRAIRLWA